MLITVLGMVITGMVWFQKRSRVFTKQNVAKATAIIGLSSVLASCTGPTRLVDEDISLERASAVVQERMIAPKTKEEQKLYALPQPKPRRTVLQVLHHPSSVSNSNFINLLQRQISDEIRFETTQKQNANETEDTQLAEVPAKELTESERTEILENRQDEWARRLFEFAGPIESSVFETLAMLENDEDNLTKKLIPGLGSAAPEFFGKNLTRDPEGYLSLPANFVFIGGRASNITTKTGLLTEFVEDKSINLAVRNMPLPDVLFLLTNSLQLQASLSNNILSGSFEPVTVQLKGGALSILDALLNQYDLAISYDPDVEVARFYTDDELTTQLANVRKAIEAYNKLQFDRKLLQEKREDIRSIQSMLALTQSLLTGDAETFTDGITKFERVGLGSDASKMLRELSEASFSLRTLTDRFDSQTEAMLDPNSASNDTSNGLTMASTQSRFDEILIEDPCIIPGQEVFIEKIAVYNKTSEAALENLQSYFTNFGGATSSNAAATATAGNAGTPTSAAADPNTNAPADANTAAATQTNALTGANAAAATQTASVGTIDLDLPDLCRNQSPSLVATPSLQADATGIIIKGTRVQNSIAVRLVTEDDTPQMQVLVEIFMVTVSKDFTRQLENLIAATDTPGGSGGNNPEAELLTQLSSAISGGYQVNLSSPTNEISSVLKFLESNQLGRVVSSPTILVDGNNGAAKISRKQVAEVLFNGTLRDNTSNEVPADQNESLEAPLSLELTNVNVLPATNNVKMNVEIINKRFLQNVSTIDRRVNADYTEDTITTGFTASPGDVIVLAGLTANADTTSTTGFPGTTSGVLAPLSGLLGGQDTVSNTLNEMVVFLAPTVFDPSSERQPHSPFN